MELKMEDIVFPRIAQVVAKDSLGLYRFLKWKLRAKARGTKETVQRNRFKHLSSAGALAAPTYQENSESWLTWHVACGQVAGGSRGSVRVRDKHERAAWIRTRDQTKERATKTRREGYRVDQEANFH